MNLRDAVLAILGGLSLTLSMAPFNLWPLALVAAAILFHLLNNKKPLDAFYRALLFSFSLFISGASWVFVSIHEFGYMPIPLACLLTFIFCLSLALINAASWFTFSFFCNIHTSHNSSRSQSILMFAATGVFTEWLRTWLFSGFPWLFAGYSQTEWVLGSWAPLIGVYGISFIIYASGAGVYVLGRSLQPNSKTDRSLTIKAVLSATLLCWLLAPLIDTIEWSQKTGAARSVSLIQANISQHEKWQPEQLASSLQLYADMSRGEWESNELVIWPEAAIANDYTSSKSFINRMGEMASTSNSALLTGVPYRFYDTKDKRWRVHNSVAGTGHAEGLYHKRQLVPFGEFIPFENIVGRLMKVFNLPMTSMQPGPTHQAAIKIHDWQARPLICYEIVYPALTAKTAQLSDVLITVSNDAWFGASFGPVQHLQMAQMRARENGRYVLRSTGSGISAVINTKGVITARTAQFERETLRGSFYLYQGLTPWGHSGYWLIPTLNIGIIIALYSYGYSRKM